MSSNFRAIIIAFFIFYSFLFSVKAQEVDSLIQVLENIPEKDSNYVTISNLISVKLQQADTDKSLEYAEKALKAAEKINFMRGVTEA